jgi:enamine deaminase RidA (YjgF/YER057c/UK114 family)
MMNSGATSILKEATVRPPGEAPAPPQWVWDLLGCASAPCDIRGEEPVVTAGGQFALASACIAEAAGMDGAELQQQTLRAYERIGQALAGRAARHLVRVWNHIPKILAPAGSLGQAEEPIDRYMAFNGGRFAAYRAWYGLEGIGQRAATASGVGHGGRDLFIHALAAERPGMAVGNPRQVPPHRYSSKYGPVPPCFARATRVEHQGRALLLAGGTSSVHGEESVHVGNLEGQARETFVNLAALVAAAREETMDEQAAAVRDRLALYRDLRVYHVRAEDRGHLAQWIGQWFTGIERLEFVPAELCRGDLLVEIEGVAAL